MALKLESPARVASSGALSFHLDYWIFPTPTWPGSDDGRPDAASSV